MKGKVKTNIKFIKKHLLTCSLFTFNHEEGSEFFYWRTGIENRILGDFNGVKKDEDGYKLRSFKSLKWAIKFCKHYKINPKCCDDFAFIHELIKWSIDEYEDIKRTVESAKEIKNFTEILSDVYLNHNFEYVQGITFHFKATSSLHIRSSEAIGFLIESIISPEGLNVRHINIELDRVRGIYKNLSHLKNPLTHDLKVFSWAILNYLNQFTHFKSPEKGLATNEQCRIIGEILIKAGLLKNRSIKDLDTLNYINRYLQLAKKYYSE